MSDYDLEESPQRPARKKSPAVIIIFTLIAVLIIAGGVWLIREFLLKGEVEIPLPREVAQAVNESLRLEDVRLGPLRITPGESAPDRSRTGRAERDDPSASGPAALDPARTVPRPGSGLDDPERPSASGILVEPGGSAVDLAPPQAPGEARLKIYEGSDAVVTLAFVNDLANYLAENYWPQGTHLAASNSAVSSASLGAAGQRYGVDLIGLRPGRAEDRRDYLRDRSLVLNYAYAPAMLEALTRLYADRFADALAEAGFRQVRGGAPMNQAEVAGMLRFYARYARAVSAALSAYTGTPDAAEGVRDYAAARDAAFSANGNLLEAQYRAENVRDLKNERELRAAEQEYRQAMLEQERAKEAVLAFMGRGESRRLQDQELLYIAGWAARRGPGAVRANQAAASAADYIAQVLDDKAAELE